MRACDRVLVAAAVAVALAGCHSAPRQRPLNTSPINEGADSMTAVRQQLQGNWVLVSLNVSTEDGQRRQIEATGRLAADGFGNLEVEYRMSDAGQKSLASLGIKSPNPIVSTAGQVVIDPQKKLISYVGEDFQKRAMGFDPTLAAARANPFALERSRYYAFGADGTLTLSTRYDSGREAAVGLWKKAS